MVGNIKERSHRPAKFNSASEFDFIYFNDVVPLVFLPYLPFSSIFKQR